jgi:hypothetical protein
MTRKQANALADSLGLIPRKVAIDVAMQGLPQANQLMEQLRGKIVNWDPQSRTLIISADAKPAIQAASDLGFYVEKLADGTYKIVPTVDSRQAGLDLGHIADMALDTRATIPVGANTDPAWAAAQAALSGITGLPLALPRIGGNTDPVWLAAQGALSGITGGLWALPRIGARPQPAYDAANTWLGRVTKWTAFPSVNARPAPAYAAAGTWLGRVTGYTAWPRVNANTGPAWSSWNAWYGAVNGAQATAYLNIVRRVSGASGLPGAGGFLGVYGHDGMIFRRYQQGGVERPGAFGRDLTPAPIGRAAIDPPNSWRLRGNAISGDRPDVDEFYIPDNDEPQSLALLDELIERRNREQMRYLRMLTDPVPVQVRALAGGGVVSGGSSSSSSSPRRSSSGLAQPSVVHHHDETYNVAVNIDASTIEDVEQLRRLFSRLGTMARMGATR